MRKITALLLAAALCFVLLLPSFAYKDSAGRYVPDLPPFVTVSGEQATINTYYNTAATADITSFFATLENGPYFVAVSQESVRGYHYITNENIGDDRTWWLHFVKPVNSSGGFTFFTRYYDENYRHDVISNTLAKPVRAGGGFQVVSYEYDFKKASFTGSSIKTLSILDFTYIIGSSPLSNRVNPNYPYYNKLGTGSGAWTFYSDPDDPQKPDRHYNWWIGQSAVVDGFDPPGTPDPPKEPGGGNYVPPGWTFPSDWLKPPSGSGSTNTIKPFDPLDPQYPGYVPPTDKPYNPLEGYTPPLMPDIPIVPGTPPVTSDPFIPGSSGAYDDPFIPGNSGAYDDPFIPGGSGAYDDPFTPGSAGNYSDPFTPGIAGDYSDPFTPGSAGDYSDPFTPGIADDYSDPFTPGNAGNYSNPFTPGNAGDYSDPFTPGNAGDYSNPFTPGSAGNYSNPFTPGNASDYIDPFTPGASGGYSNPFSVPNPPVFSYDPFNFSLFSSSYNLFGPNWGYGS